MIPYKSQYPPEHDKLILFQYYTDQFDLMATEVDKAKKEKEILQQEKKLRLNKQKIHQVKLCSVSLLFHSWKKNVF